MDQKAPALGAEAFRPLIPPHRCYDGGRCDVYVVLDFPEAPEARSTRALRGFETFYEFCRLAAEILVRYYSEFDALAGARPRGSETRG